jgi:tRNA (guanine-N7-)-methyltransferase
MVLAIREKSPMHAVMTANYQHFFTQQNGPHKHLINIIGRNMQCEFRRPIPGHQYIAFKQIEQFVEKIGRPIIIDSCCGTGHSSHKLSSQFPDHAIIGIDKSRARLSRSPKSKDNCLLIQGDVIDLWRLIAQTSWPIERHYLLYPNPWPKACHVKRRFYAHPIWPILVQLAPYLEIRCNWSLYAEEAMIALGMLSQTPVLRQKIDSEYMSLFEKKYIEASCSLYIIENQLI